MPEKELGDQQNSGGSDSASGESNSKGTLGEAIPADVESAMREQAGSNQEKINVIIEDTLRVYKEAKKTGPIHQAIDKADEFMDSAARGAGIGTERLMELFTEKIPPDELTTASQEVADNPAESKEPTETRPPLSALPEAEPKAESRISEEEKDTIIQTTLDVFREGLGTSSVSAAEEAARERFKEAAGKLNKKTYEELHRRVTQGMNSLEAEERKKVSGVGETLTTKPEDIRDEPPIPRPESVGNARFEPTEQKDQEPDDLAAVRIEAQKLGIAFSDQATAEDIKNRVQERLRFENTQTERPVPPPTSPEEPSKVEKSVPLMSEAPTPESEHIETPTPPPTEVGTETIELPPSELTAEELEAVFAVAKAEKVDGLPRNVQEKLSRGLNEVTFLVEGNKNKFFAGAVEKAGEKLNLDQKGTLGRFVSSLAETFRRNQVKAKEKYEAANTLSNLSSLAGNLLRYGRLVLGITGYSVTPLGPVMLGAMAFSRGAEAAKEARFKNEEVIKKTRVGDEENVSQADLDRAEDEAWKIYEAAQGKAGGAEVSSAELNRAFMEGLPRDILERLDRYSSPEKITSAADIARNLTERWINFSLERVQKKLDQAETEAEKQKILKKYEGKLNDFNRLVGDYGQIDALAMGAKISEGLAKGVRQAMTVETLFELPFAAQKIWSDLAGVLGERGETPDVANLRSFADEVAESTRTSYARMLGVNLEDGCDENEANKIADDIFRLRSEGKKGTAAAAVDIFGSLKTSDTNRSITEIVSSREGKLTDFYDRVLGVDSKDGLDTDEAVKIFGSVNKLIAADRTNEFDKVMDVYGGMEVKGVGKTLEDWIKESALTSAGGEVEAPTETPTLESEQSVGAKPTHFENIIDSSQVEGSDSVWKSTRELFMQNRHRMDYNASKDWPPSEWADKKTAELVKEYADAHGGQAPELVHNGDKVVVETGADGKYHLKVVSSSGEAVEPRALPNQESSLKYGWVKAEPIGTENINLKVFDPSVSESPEIKTDPAMEKLAREYGALPMDSKRDEFVYNYIATEIEKPAYRQLKLPHMNEEKLIAFARMFGGGDWARISEPEKLAQTLVEFDNSMKFYTRKLVDGSLDEIFKAGGERALELTHDVFPVEAQDGEIFYAQKDKSGLWRIADSNGNPVELKRPIMGKTSLLDLKKVKNLLGYKSLENMPELPAEPNLETPTPLSESEQAVPPREAAEKEAAIQKSAAPELAEKQNQEIPVDIAIGEGSFQGKVEVTPNGAVRFEGNATRMDPSKILREDWRRIMIDEIGGKRDLNFGMRNIKMGARNVMIQQEVAKAIAAEKPAVAAALRNAAQRQIELLEKTYGDIFK